MSGTCALGALRFPQFDDAEVRIDFFLAGQRFDELEHALTHARVGDLRERAHKLETFGARHEFHHVGTGIDVGRARRVTARAAHRGVAQRHVVEEVRHGHAENVGDFIEPAGADTIGALFVLLDLLEREAQKFAKFSWLIPISIRRKRTRLPTCPSTAEGCFLAKGGTPVTTDKKLDAQPPECESNTTK